MADEADRWRRVEQLCAAALERAGGERTAFLRDACGDDEALRREVEQLLAQESQADGFLHGSVATVAAAVMGPTGTSLTGRRLNALEVGALIGAGGMGEVYRARDTELKRDVALKVLPAALAGDAERLARFRREAEVLASLNHPNIASIYGLEQGSGFVALMMELVEGDDLSERIARGAIPLDDALPIARQVAEALEAAHERGIMHRDLKPANIKVRADGVVKVLDFGLAKFGQPELADRHDDDPTSPTITSPARMTGIGVVLGTAAYMSPEQAKGRPVDKRTDIWAFGVVLFEMLAGVRPFVGEDVADVLGAVVRLEPNWNELPSDVPQVLRTLLQSCLVKDRQRRVSAVSTVRFVLDNAQSLMPSAGTAAAVLVPRGQRWRRIAAVTLIALVAAAIASAAVWLAVRPLPAPLIRTTVLTSGAAVLSPSGSDRNVTITPDGSRIVYRGDNHLLLRSLKDLEPTVLSGLGSPRGVFISPDGQWIGFFDGTASLKKVAITGGPSVLIANLRGPSSPRGATWGLDGTIIFATNNPATGLQRVAAAGGDPTMLTTPDREHGQGYHSFPEFLPGGRAVLFTITPVGGQTANAQLAVLDLQTGTSKMLGLGGSDAHYLSTGHLLYTVAGTLRAVPFDLGGLEVAGTPAPVLAGVATTLTGVADIAIAANGTVAYVPSAGGFTGEQSVVSVDHEGRASALPNLPVDSYRDVRVSPDNTRLALATQNDIWIYDRTRSTMRRLTTNPANDTRPVWTPNGQRIVFASRRAGYPELFWRQADSTGDEERILARSKDLVDLRPDGWSADGKQLLFTEVPSNYQASIGQIAIERPSGATVLVKSEFYNDFPAVSPDGGWIAYESDVSGLGQYEIYAERYPELGSRQLISTGGGRLPLWSHDGRELFFSSRNGQQMMSVSVQTGTTLVAGPPHVAFNGLDLGGSDRLGGGSRRYDIAPDGQFFVIRSAQGSGSSLNIVLVQNWFEELKRLVPTK